MNQKKTLHMVDIVMKKKKYLFTIMVDQDQY